MKRILLVAALALATSSVFAQSAGSQATGQSASDAGAQAMTGPITFEASQQRGHTSVDTTPTIYTPPSAFGYAPEGNCGKSSSGGAGATGWGFGFSLAGESDPCNGRADTSTAARLGMIDVARMRFFCFGEDRNRMAFEAAGHQCPGSATARGLDNAATSSPRVADSRDSHVHAGVDGSLGG